MQRINRFGCSSACIEGILASQTPFVAIMDVDGQHDETLLPVMYDMIQKENLDVVVASRYFSTGNFGKLEKKRVIISKGATYLAKKIGKVPLTDPMSGFFMIRRATLEPFVSRLFCRGGFRTLLDIFLAAPQPLIYKEIPYTMRVRQLGESKISVRVALDLLLLLAFYLTDKWIPFDFVVYVLVGLLGAVFHLTILGFILGICASFIQAQAIATICTIFVNFYFNNKITFYYIRLKGPDLWKGFFKFVFVCSVGFAINLALSDYMYKASSLWLLSGGIGFFISGVWNYLCSKTIVWQTRARFN
jgi:dolichol-phosphate mannosyltransferase